MIKIIKQMLPVLIVLGLSVALIIVIAVSNQDKKAAILESVEDAFPPERTAGSQNPKVTLVEYSDFECSACASYEPLIKQLREEFKDQMRFVYKYYPLFQIHPNAKLSSYAAQAAGLQGKFWEMHDLLFVEQKTWASSRNARQLMLEYAATIGLDTVRFEADLDSAEVKKAVETDYNQGTRTGIQGTPTFFVNGKSISNPKNYNELKSIIEAEIAKK